MRVPINLKFFPIIIIWLVQVTPGVTLSNVTLPNNLLLNSYFESSTVGLYFLYVLNMHANFQANRV